MRGEIRSFAFDDKLWAIDGRTSDQGLGRLCHGLWTTYDDVCDHVISVPRETWENLRRCLAVLETDLEFVEVKHVSRPKDRAWAALGLAALAAAAVLSFWIKQWLVLASVWAVLSIVWVVVQVSRTCHQSCENLPAEFDFAPFRSESQWRTYEPLVARFDLPAYDPAKCHVPVRSRWAGALMNIPWYALLSLLVPLCLIRALFAKKTVMLIVRD